MGTFLKQAEVADGKKKREPKKQSRQDPITTDERVRGFRDPKPIHLDGIEYALESLADHVGRYVNNSVGSDGHNVLALFTGPEGSGYYPLLIALEPTSESTERLLTALEGIAAAFGRIADAMTGHKAEGGGSNLEGEGT